LERSALDPQIVEEHETQSHPASVRHLDRRVHVLHESVREAGGKASRVEPDPAPAIREHKPPHDLEPERRHGVKIARDFRGVSRDASVSSPDVGAEVAPVVRPPLEAAPRVVDAGDELRRPASIFHTFLRLCTRIVVQALRKLTRFEMKQMALLLGRSTLLIAAVSLSSAGCAQKPGFVPGWLGPAIAVGGVAAAATSGKDEPIVKQITPQLWVSASQLDFGTIGIAERGSRQLEIRNVSRFDLRLITAQSSSA